MPGLLRRRVSGLTQCSSPQQRPDAPALLQFQDQPGDAPAEGDQILDEPLQVLDEPVLVGEEDLLFDVMEVDGPLQGPHEGAGVVGEGGEPAGQRVKSQVNFGLIRLFLGCQHEEGPQLGDDVVQGDGLQGASPPERLVVDGQRLLGRFSGPGELVDEPLPVEVLDGGDAGGVGVGAEIAPADEAVQRLHHGVQVRGAHVGREGGVHVLGAQMYGEPLLGEHERPHHLTVETCVLHAEVGEGAVPVRAGLLSGGAGGHRRPLSSTRSPLGSDTDNWPVHTGIPGFTPVDHAAQTPPSTISPVCSSGPTTSRRHR